MSGTFAFAAPTLVHFGWGARAELPALLEGHTWGIVTSAGMPGRDWYKDLERDLAAAGAPTVLLGTISPNPRLSEVEGARARATGASVHGVVAIGGGSVIDAAKLLGVALRYGTSASEVLDDIAGALRRDRVADCPVVAVPSTAGTGAEVSQGAIITDDRTGRKRAARGAALIPTRAVIDPELTLTAPPRVIAEAGFDVVAHAMETFLSRAATPLTDVLARAALDVVPGALLRALAVPGDRDASTALSLHAWLMGYNLANASTCLPHRLQYPVGAATDSSHQIGLAAVYPAWIRRVTRAAPERATEALDRVRASVRAVTGEELGAEPGAAMRQFLDHLGMAVTLDDLGLRRESAAALAAEVDGRIDLDPIAPDRATLVQIFEEAFAIQ